MLMTSIRSTLSAVAVAGGLTAAILGATPASAEPVPPPAPVLGEVPPPNAPPKPAEMWNGEPVVWISGWGGRWGVWKNGYFITLSSNINTGGG
jgi:pimeloyl-ACP methyl ester carboxylesterase